MSGGADALHRPEWLRSELNWLRNDNGNFMLDVWVPPPAAIDPRMLGKDEFPFRRQP